MAILIEGMEMPENCAHCRMWACCPALHNEEWPDYESIITNDVIGDGGAEPGVRHPDCPLVEVPEPHGDLIDLKELENVVEQFCLEDEHGDLHWWNALMNADIVIPATEEG